MQTGSASKAFFFNREDSEGTWCFGENRNRVLGVDENVRPDEPFENKSFVMVSTAKTYSLGWDANDQCWVTGLVYNISYNLTEHEEQPEEERFTDSEGEFTLTGLYRSWTQISNLSDRKIIHVSSGAYHTIMMDDQHRVWATGKNNYGQCGLGRDVPYTVLSEIQFPTDSPMKIIVAGYKDSLFLTQDNQLFGTGRNQHNQLGVEGMQFVPVPIPFSGQIRSIVSGKGFSLLLTTEGVVYCSGDVSGSTSNDLDAGWRLVDSLPHCSAIFAGRTHYMMVENNSDVWGLGSKEYLGLQVTRGESPICQEPVRLDFLSGCQFLSLGYYNSIAVDVDGWLVLVGWNGTRSQCAPQRLPDVPQNSVIPQTGWEYGTFSCFSKYNVKGPSVN